MTTASIKTGDPEAVLRETIAMLDTPRAPEMLAPVEQALRQAPKDFRLWHVHGLILRQLDRRELAIPSLERSRNWCRRHRWSRMASPGHCSRRACPASTLMAARSQLAPGDSAIMLGMTAALLADGEGDAAVRGLERIVGRSPLWVEGHKRLSEMRWLSGEREGFTRSFDEALKLHPTNYELRREQILALLHAEHWQTLLGVIESGRRAMGDLPLFSANEAVCYAELGETARADRLFEPFADVDDALLQIRRVRHLLRSGRPEQAAAGD